MSDERDKNVEAAVRGYRLEISEKLVKKGISDQLILEIMEISEEELDEIKRRIQQEQKQFGSLWEHIMDEGRERVLLRLLKSKLQKGKTKTEIIEDLAIIDEEEYEVLREKVNKELQERHKSIVLSRSNLEITDEQFLEEAKQLEEDKKKLGFYETD